MPIALMLIFYVLLERVFISFCLLKTGALIAPFQQIPTNGKATL